MQAIRIHHFGGPETMEIDDIPNPQPKPDEVLVRVLAASINPVDYKTRSGHYPRVTDEQLPTILGRDVAGTIEDCGADVSGFKTGDAIYALLPANRGGFAEYVTIPAAAIAPKPATLDFVQAAAVPLAGLTAWQGLFDHGELARGESVLIHGGGGGVGHLAVQFAVAAGAHVAATVSSDDVDFVRGLGANPVIDYKHQRFEAVVRDMDLVLDLIGGETQQRSWKVLKRGGRLVSTLGEPSQQTAVRHGVRAAGFLVQPSGPELAKIGELIAAGKVRPRVQDVLPFARAGDAEQRLEQEHVQGKLVLRLAA